MTSNVKAPELLREEPCQVKQLQHIEIAGVMTGTAGALYRSQAIRFKDLRILPPDNSISVVCFDALLYIIMCQFVPWFLHVCPLLASAFIFA